MEIIGHGIDVVDLERFGRLLSEEGGDFLSRCFTRAEQARAATGEVSKDSETLAGKFAAKHFSGKGYVFSGC